MINSFNKNFKKICRNLKSKKKIFVLGLSGGKDSITLLYLLKDFIEKNNEFRIKWPRGDMGSLPADSEQFMLIEFLSGQVEAIQKDLQNMMNNAVNIERLQKDMDKALADIEELKDKIRSVKNGHTGE